MVHKVTKAGQSHSAKTRVGIVPPINIRQAKDRLEEKLNKGLKSPKYAISFVKKESGFQLEVRAKFKKDLHDVPHEFGGFKVNKTVVTRL